MRALSCLFLILVGVLLVGSPAVARQDDPRLKELFSELKTATSSLEVKVVEARIWDIWTKHGDPRIDALMARGADALSVEDLDTALAAYNEVVKRDDTFAEGFNKRATVEYLRGDYTASVADIERTLALEPRHFGALSGLGEIYLKLKRKEAALKAFEAALKINPHLKGAQAHVKELKEELEGNPT
jgi:tetratricopeptide (TPR) repeat protein